MSAYTTRKIRGATVRSYVADTSEEEKREIVQGVLRVCAQDLLQRKKLEEIKAAQSKIGFRTKAEKGGG